MNHNKPITLVRDEFIKNIVELCNNSGLPFFVIEDVLKNLIQEIHGASLQQLEEDKKRYEEQTAQKSEE
jgi:hypothetical protein